MKRRDHFFSYLFFSFYRPSNDVANPRSSIYRCRSMTRWKDRRVGRSGGKEWGKTEKGGDWGPTTILDRKHYARLFSLLYKK